MKELDLFHAQDKNEQLVFVERNKAMTTSLKVAEHFGKEHSKVLMSIEQLECSDSFREANFGLSFYSKDLIMVIKNYQCIT